MDKRYWVKINDGGQVLHAVPYYDSVTGEARTLCAYRGEAQPGTDLRRCRHCVLALNRILAEIGWPEVALDEAASPRSAAIL